MKHEKISWYTKKYHETCKNITIHEKNIMMPPLFDKKSLKIFFNYEKYEKIWKKKCQLYMKNIDFIDKF